MDAVQVLKEVGWIGILIIWAMDKFFPRLWTFLTDKLFPVRALERAKKIQQIEDDAKAKRDTDASLLRAKLERELREEEHRRKMEERIADALEKMIGAITINNERLSQLVNVTSSLSNFTSEAVGDMRVTVEKLHKRESQPKINRKRVTK